MSMKGRISEAFSFVLAKEFRIAQFNVIDLVARTFSVQFLPFFVTAASLTWNEKKMFQEVNRNSENQTWKFVLQSSRSMKQQGHKCR